MVSSFYSDGSGNIVQNLPAGGAKTTQITSNPSEVETSDGLKVHIDRRAHCELSLFLTMYNTFVIQAQSRSNLNCLPIVCIVDFDEMECRI